jgi:glycosyltransferase involved in cell wall biosynthesis
VIGAKRNGRSDDANAGRIRIFHMKIMQVTTELRVAGAERVVAALACRLARDGHEVAVVSLMPLPKDPRQSIVPELKKANVKVIALGVTKLTPWRLRRLRNVVRDFAPDVVHSHLIHANLAARLFAAGRKRPLINTVHTVERRPSTRWHFWLDRLTFGRCTCQTAVSEVVRNFHAARTGVDPAVMPVIRNGIAKQAPVSPAHNAELRSQWGMQTCTWVIGSVGRLDWYKGYDLLLSASAAIAGVIPSGETWGLVVIGEGPERTALEKMAALAPANVRVVLPGFRADAAECMGAFDLFVMPSRYEGFGLALAEAMAHGIPVLANRCDSLPEIAAGYPSAAFLDFADASRHEIAAALKAALALGRCAPDTRFTIDNMANEYVAAYEAVLR